MLNGRNITQSLWQETDMLNRSPKRRLAPAAIECAVFASTKAAEVLGGLRYHIGKKLEFDAPGGLSHANTCACGTACVVRWGMLAGERGLATRHLPANGDFKEGGRVAH